MGTRSPSTSTRTSTTKSPDWSQHGCVNTPQLGSSNCRFERSERQLLLPSCVWARSDGLARVQDAGGVKEFLDPPLELPDRFRLLQA
jgi:hypothetical protein